MIDRVKVIGRSREHLKLFCPGCQTAHVISIPPAPNAWDWNCDAERPTISPSILVQGGSDNITCHSFVRDGRIQFLSDCTHELAGQTVELGHHSPA